MGKTLPKKTQNNAVGAKKTQRGQIDGVNGNAKKTQGAASPRAASSPKFVVHFVYSEAVLSALKDELNTRPTEEGRARLETNHRQANVEITRLPDIYQHVVNVGLDRFDMDGSQLLEPPSSKPLVDVSRDSKQRAGKGKLSLPAVTITSQKKSRVTPVKSERKHKTDILTLPIH